MVLGLRGAWPYQHNRPALPARGRIAASALASPSARFVSRDGFLRASRASARSPLYVARSAPPHPLSRSPRLHRPQHPRPRSLWPPPLPSDPDVVSHARPKRSSAIKPASDTRSKTAGGMSSPSLVFQKQPPPRSSESLRTSAADGDALNLGAEQMTHGRVAGLVHGKLVHLALIARGALRSTPAPARRSHRAFLVPKGTGQHLSASSSSSFSRCWSFRFARSIAFRASASVTFFNAFGPRFPRLRNKRFIRFRNKGERVRRHVTPLALPLASERQPHPMKLVGATLGRPSQQS